MFSLLEFIVFSCSGIFVGSRYYRKLSFELSLPQIVEEADLLADDFFSDLDSLQVKQTEVSAVTILDKKSTSIKMIDFLHFFR